MTVIGFFGSRNGCYSRTIEAIFKKLSRFNVTIVVGDCIGVDKAVYDYCKANGIPVRVIATLNNWEKISYKPDPKDILEYVGSPEEPLRVRLAKRTRRFVEYVKSKNGFLIGINTSGKGSQLAIKIAKQLGVRVYVNNESSKRAIMYFDGACLPVNPGGVATYGFAILLNGEVIARECGVAAENGTNNVAEYTALIKGLEKALELGIEELTVRGDSQLAINQMKGIYAVKSPRIYPLWKRAQELAAKFRKIEFEWVPREDNKIADELSARAYIEHAEQKSIEKSNQIGDGEIKHLHGPIYAVRGYTVDIEKKTCTCPHYMKVNGYKLLKRSGIVIRCKHILAAGRFKQRRTSSN